MAEIQNRRKECETVKQEMLRHFDVIGADSVSFYVRERDTNITDAVQDLSGMDDDFEDLKDEAKNE